MNEMELLSLLAMASSSIAVIGLAIGYEAKQMIVLAAIGVSLVTIMHFMILKGERRAASRRDKSKKSH